MKTLATIQGGDIILQNNGWVTFRADADIDGDGANGQHGGLPCYAPHSYTGVTLDDLRNAGHPGNWFGVLTDDGKSTGTPVLQAAHHPRPGAYISTTSLHLLGPDGKPLDLFDPMRYVDAATVSFIVVPEIVAIGAPGIVLGCSVKVTNTRNGRICWGIVADFGPSKKDGEISPAMATLLGLNPSARNGGEDEHIIDYEVHPGEIATINGVTYPLQPLHAKAA